MAKLRNMKTASDHQLLTPGKMYVEETNLRLQRTHLDEIDQMILIYKVSHPRMTNEEIADAIGNGMTRRDVWKRIRKGPLGTVLKEMAEEAIDTTKGLIIESAVSAIQTLDNLAQGKDPRTKKTDQTIPHSVMRQAAKDILDILRGAGLDQKKGDDTEPEVWEAQISKIGVIQAKRLPAGSGDDAIPVTPSSSTVVPFQPIEPTERKTWTKEELDAWLNEATKEVQHVEMAPEPDMRDLPPDETE